MKCLEMKLDWKLETLKAVMISAEKVSSRKKLIQESLSMKEQKQGIDVFASLKTFRKQFVRKVSAKMKMSFPRVKLIKPCNNVVNSSYTEEQKQAVSSIALERTEMNNEPPDMEITEPFLPNNLKELSEEEFEFDSQSISNGVTETNSYDCQLDQLHISENENSNRIVTCEIDENVEVEFCPGPSSSSVCSIQSSVHHNEGNVSDILQEEIEETTGLDRQFPFSQAEANDGNELDEVASKNVEYNEIDPVSSDVKVKANIQISVGDREDVSSALEFIAIKNENIKTESPKNIRRPRQRNGNIRWKKSRAHLRKHLRDLRQSRSGQVPSLKECALRKLVKVKYVCRVRPCKSKVFRNIKDRMRHSRLHGNFKCHFCNISMKYAPHIIEHEISKHNKRFKGKTKKSEKLNTCPRCDFHGKNRGQLVAHHFASHLKLTPNENRTCPICDLLLDRRSGVVDAFLKHYLTCHDLTKMDPKLAKKCDAPNCSAYFRTLYQLLMHKARVHNVDKQKKFNCMDCGKQFMRIQFLREHRKLMHYTKEEFIVSCTFKECKRSFECEEDMQRHKKSSHGFEIAKCTDCGKVVSKKFMGLHMVTHKQANDWMQKINLTPEICTKFGIHPNRCKIPACFKLFYNEKDFSTHSKLHGEFKCNHCEAIFSFAKDLPLHEMSHNSDENHPSSSNSSRSTTYTCSRCLFFTEDETEFRSHFLNKHLNLFLDHHTCPICNVQINSRDPRHIRRSISSHFKTMHEVKSGGNVYNCGYDGCSSYFVTKLQLIAHRNTHMYKLKSNNEVKRFECKLCNKALKTKQNLLNHHNKIHINSSRTIPCSSDACPRRFETQEGLNDHLNESPVVICEICGKSFHEFSGLAVHSQVHRRSIKNNFDCTTCGKKLKSKENLRVHELSHSGPDSWEFVCSVCGRKVMTKQKLVDHLRTHSEDKTYFICDICGAKYSHRHNLRIHVNNKHGDIIKDEPRKYTKTNLTSRKGVKRKSPSGSGASQAKKPARRGTRNRNRRKRKLSSTSDSDTDY